MNYTDTVNWMFSQLPMYQNKGQSAYKADLSNIILLADHLKHPENQFKSVHVAGTNGKGSTSHMLASILQEANYTVGLYTSPHLKDFRERIKINGQCISKQFVIQFIKRNKAFFEQQKFSFFEMTVGMAFEYFAKNKVDIGIIEVGLGGRLDSTNIIIPEVSVITNIGYDHTPFLGKSMSQIAKEKGGIIKSKIPVVIGETQEETKSIFRKLADDHSSKITFADQRTDVSSYKSDLLGSYQKHNIRTAVQTIEELTYKGFDISNDHIRSGLLNVIKNTGLLGRWQILQTNPKVICDTAHNKEGLIYIMNQLGTEKYDHLHFVLGFVKEKNLDEIIRLFPKKASYYFCKPQIERGMNAIELKAEFVKRNYKGEVYNSVKNALKSALKNAKNDDLIYVGGSTFVVAEIL
ncbi:MAG: bifunctional folylpolyglutamate synthase/dihydrofolate synthase [Flavobacteriaceae bacterium]|nr:bifunctional folylpolyglutamate synthase/dihydrofolate synthase [Flavobacteriaceae bacterium]